MTVPAGLMEEYGVVCDQPAHPDQLLDEPLYPFRRDFARASDDFRAAELARARRDYEGALDHLRDALANIARARTPARLTMALDLHFRAAHLAAQAADSAACWEHSAAAVEALAEYPAKAVSDFLTVPRRLDPSLIEDMRYFSGLSEEVNDPERAHMLARTIIEDEARHEDDTSVGPNEADLAFAIAILERQDGCARSHAAQAASRLVSRGWAAGVSDEEMGVRLERALRLSESIPWPEMSITLLAQAVVLTIRRGNRAQAIAGIVVLSNLTTEGLDDRAPRERSRIMLQRRKLAAQATRAALRAVEVRWVTRISLAAQVVVRYLRPRGELESNFDLDLLRDPARYAPATAELAGPARDGA